MPAVRPCLHIRADASPGMGTGHVMRCLALAQWASLGGWEVFFSGRVLVPWLWQRLHASGIPFRFLSGDAPRQENPEHLLGDLGPYSPGDWLVLDGYHFGPDCQKAARKAGLRLLVIDDYAHLPCYFCDILLNQNPGCETFPYEGEIGARLLGPEYALLRPEFARAREMATGKAPHNTPQNILLTLGGGDFSSHLGALSEALAVPELHGRRLRVIVAAMPEADIKESLAACSARLEMTRRADDMASLLRETDLCITAGGSTCWELCCLGTPFLTVEVAENQKGIIAWLDANAYAARFSAAALREALASPAYLQNRREKILQLCDGVGATRVLHFLAGEA